VEEGDVVRVQGTVNEFFDQTELTSIVNMTDCGVTDTASASSISLPQSSVDDWEATEGMAVTFTQTLYASGNFTQARYGEVDLAVDGPLDNPTNVVAPGAPAIALQAVNWVQTIPCGPGTVSRPSRVSWAIHSASTKFIPLQTSPSYAKMSARWIHLMWAAP
jgi:predicted extracellular nuclease